MSGGGQYIYTVVTAAILASIIRTILPGKGIASDMVKLTMGIFLVMIVISPILKVRIEGIRNYIEYIETYASKIITDAEENTKREIQNSIEQNTQAYILNKASELGAEILVEITYLEENSYVPHSIIITGSASPMIRKQLSAIIQTELGISEDFQTWKLA